MDHLPFIIPHADGSRFIFGVDQAVFMEKHRGRVIVLFLVLTLVFIGNYLLIRRILAPIKWLKRGVIAVSQGDLKHEIPLRTHPDELRDLSASFNAMPHRIQEMLRARDQLLLDVSHELRSPITRMKLALEFLPDDKTRIRIHDDLAEMETMITEILESERLTNGHHNLKLDRTNIIGLIQNLVQDYKARPPGIKMLNLPANCYLKIDRNNSGILSKKIEGNE